jgi:hypothetical protein
MVSQQGGAFNILKTRLEMLSMCGPIVVLSKIGQIIFQSLRVIRWKSENPNLQKVAKFCEGAYNIRFSRDFPPSIL